MRYIAAYLLAVLGGHPNPTENEVVKILQAADVEIDTKRVAALVKAMDGKNIDEVLAAGSKKLASFGATAAAPVTGGAPAPGAQTAKAEEKVVEEEEEVDMGGGMDMFGGDEDY